MFRGIQIPSSTSITVPVSIHSNDNSIITSKRRVRFAEKFSKRKKANAAQSRNLSLPKELKYHIAANPILTGITSKSSEMRSDRKQHIFPPEASNNSSIISILPRLVEM